MKRYWVIGGTYTDTRFDRMQDGGKEQKFGPFKSYDEAKAEWQRRAWNSVDNACARYRIEEDSGETWYWVVGGPYADSGFQEPAAGGGEEWHGPYKTYDEAKIEWSRLAWSTVDDAMSRYRIEKLAYGERPRKAN
jgi:hypothetical protein